MLPLIPCGTGRSTSWSFLWWYFGQNFGQSGHRKGTAFGFSSFLCKLVPLPVLRELFLSNRSSLKSSAKKWFSHNRVFCRKPIGTRYSVSPSLKEVLCFLLCLASEMSIFSNVLPQHFVRHCFSVSFAFGLQSNVVLHIYSPFY